MQLLLKIQRTLLKFAYDLGKKDIVKLLVFNEKININNEEKDFKQLLQKQYRLK